MISRYRPLDILHLGNFRKAGHRKITPQVYILDSGKRRSPAGEFYSKGNYVLHIIQTQKNNNKIIKSNFPLPSIKFLKKIKFFFDLSITFKSYVEVKMLTNSTCIHHSASETTHSWQYCFINISIHLFTPSDICLKQSNYFSCKHFQCVFPKDNI